MEPIVVPASHDARMSWFDSSCLNFQATETPPWRNPDEVTSSKMMCQIKRLQENYKAALLHPVNGPFVKSATACYVRTAAIQWILDSNQLDMAGTQNLPDTLAAIDAGLLPSSSLEARETHGTVAALALLQLRFEEAERSNKRQALTGEDERSGEDLRPYKASHSLLLTEDNIKECHRVLLRPAFPHIAGEYRTSVVKTRLSSCPEQWYTFTAPDLVPNTATSVVDQHNLMLDSMSESAGLAEYIALAAWIFLRFVSLHPFSDGNGRVSRLLADYTLKLCCPFPVSLMPITTHPCPRDCYIEAVIAARGVDGTLLSPTDISALIVENVWRQWRFLTETCAKSVPGSHAGSHENAC